MDPNFRSVLDRYLTHCSEETSRIAMAAVVIAADKGRVDADDLHEVKDLVAPTRKRQIFGAVLGGLKSRAIMVIVGEKGSSRGKINHARPIKVFGLTPDWRSRWIQASDFPCPREFLDLQASDVHVDQRRPVDDILREHGRMASNIASITLVAHRALAANANPYDALREISELVKDKKP